MFVNQIFSVSNLSHKMKLKTSIPEKPWLMLISAATLISISLLVFLTTGNLTSLFLLSPVTTPIPTSTSALLTSAILHYATSSITPQQSRAEISISYRVLRKRSPCNFLIFGLGHDSLMWHSFNSGGTTVFLEEDPKWLKSVLKDSPILKGYFVKYRTQLVEADSLLKNWKNVDDCLPENGVDLRKNSRCRLALNMLPDVVYEKEWDVIMIDAPKGYFNEAPGRMAAIYSAAVMARNRKGPGPTDIFLHDVDRKVEKTFAMEFLCKKYFVEGVGRLWHFRVPAVKGNSTTSSRGFC